VAQPYVHRHQVLPLHARTRLIAGDHLACAHLCCDPLGRRCDCLVDAGEHVGDGALRDCEAAKALADLGEPLEAESRSDGVDLAQLTVKTYETASAFLAVAPTVCSGCIIDVRMSGISGIDLLRRLKEMSASRHRHYRVPRPVPSSRPSGPKSARIALLTNREHEVLDRLVAGHPNKIIAFDLNISPRTLDIYRTNVMTKMKRVAYPSWCAWPWSPA
jgi:two-component system, LuxR family, response regulator FixJ